MTRIHEIAAYTDELLETRNTPDYSSALNGLQFENQSEIKGVAAAVDFSTRAINAAIAANANLLLVHHGMFWDGPSAITGPSYKKVRLLIENDIAVYSSHLPLDRHPRFGNNVLLAKQLGLEPTTPFARYEGIFIGVSGESEIETALLIERARTFARNHDADVRTTLVGKHRKTKRWAICTGAGAAADTLKEARQMDIDTLIVGEGPHWTAVYAEENDLTIIYAGHYATETLGVSALADHLGEKYRITSSFISAPTGL